MSASFDAAASVLLAEQGGRLPDLSGVTVLVPNHHVAAGFLAALRRQVAVPVFLPPHLVSLPALAASAGPAEAQADSLRLAALHGFLARQGWLDEAALWPLAQGLLDLLGELDDARLVPPDDYAGFLARIERAAAPPEREARLVFELWRAFQRAAPSPRRAYAEGLARWLEAAAGPLYSLGLSGLSRLEEHFLAACRDAVGLVELPLAEPYPARRALLDVVWRAGPEAAGLRTRAQDWAAAMPASPLGLELLAAADLESEARAVARRIRAWLTEGRRSIAIVALDRLAARRLRALLERDGILVQDETGWTFSTATVSHVLDRWLALLADGFYHRDLLDFLKSPFLFGDLPMSERLAAVTAFERVVARQNTVAGLDRFMALAAAEAPGVTAMLARIADAARAWRGGRRTLSGWLELLFASLDRLAARGPVQADMAGRQLLDLLGRLAGELAGDETPYPLAGWRAWLDLQLDRATFVADEVESPIRLTHLAAARLRDFDAAVILGATPRTCRASATPGCSATRCASNWGCPGNANGTPRCWPISSTCWPGPGAPWSPGRPGARPSRMPAVPGWNA
ncbi:hypothetical protein [Parasulfuritortus cantonensis]|uniref:hypothetical protein n=1 Tax=Parasulfuritortus cantonensis TaxID=2528202 RepID=UPI00140472DA|nr:hypothetical protein [Parasulfuritortus cantonensis]